MSARMIDRNSIGLDQDWEESDAAFTCPVCTKVFIVIPLFHQDGGSTKIPRDKSSGSGQSGARRNKALAPGIGDGSANREPLPIG